MAKGETPICSRCGRPMQFLLVRGKRGRKFQCLDCDGDDPMNSVEVARLLAGELGRSETI
jgi:hypothetical protein